MYRHFAPLALVLAGCAQSLSTFQPAHVAPKGHVQAEVGGDLALPTGTIGDALSAGRTLARAADERQLTAEEQRRLIDSGTRIALNPPFFVWHAGLAYVPWDRWELGLRWSSHAWRLGARHQLKSLEQDGYDFTIGLGVQRFSYDYPLSNLLDYLSVDEYVRWNVDVPVLWGVHGDAYRLWGGPKLLVSRFDTRISEQLPPVGGIQVPALAASATGTAFYAGGQGGLAVGWKRLFVGFELTVMRLFGEGTLSLSGQNVDERRTLDLGSWIFYPGLALMGEF
jgi:hypothetical protein